jgi:hypothetical protein
MLNSLVGIIASSGGAVAGGAYESIASATGTGSSGTITFSSIPSTYVSLQLRANIISTADAISLRIRLNNDTGNNYTLHRLIGDGSTVTASGATPQSSMLVSPPGSVFTVNPTTLIFDLHNYASTTQNKTARWMVGSDRNGSGGVTLGSNLWQSTTAVNQVEIYLQSDSFTTGTTISLYGIKGA